MATRERVQHDTICDRPGCGRRVTDKGGAMRTIGHDLVVVEPTEESKDHVDLCRECLQQIGAAWNRKAGDE